MKEFKYEHKNQSNTVRFSSRKKLSKEDIIKTSDALRKLVSETTFDHQNYSKGLKALKVLTSQIIDNRIVDNVYDSSERFGENRIVV